MGRSMLSLTVTKNDKLNIFIDGKFIMRVFLNQFGILCLAPLMFELEPNIDAIRDNYFKKLRKVGVSKDHPHYKFYVQWEAVMKEEDKCH